MEYVTVEGVSTGELIEKKSRFIARLEHVNTADRALAILEEERKKYYDARHHCFAYITGQAGDNKRFGDDGEPQGTAGRPMLEVLEGENITFCMVVVTRYFGGTLLGTGGLSRAYSGACRIALDNAVKVKYRKGGLLSLNLDYNDVGKIMHILGEMGLGSDDALYRERVMMNIWLPQEEIGGFRKKVTDATAGRTGFEEKGMEFRPVRLK